MLAVSGTMALLCVAACWKLEVNSLKAFPRRFFAFLVHIKYDIGVAALFVVLTGIITYPLIFNLTTMLAQSPHWGTDAFHHTYVLWWFKTAIFDLHISPINLPLIQYPTGGVYPVLLTFAFVYLPGIPLLFFLPPSVVYNLLFLANFFLAGIFAYALCTYLTGNRWAGILGGVIYAFYPGHMAHALSGHLELALIYPFPLYLFCLVRLLRAPSWRRALLMAATLVPCLLIQPIYIPFLAMPFTLVVLVYAFRDLPPATHRQTWVKLVLGWGVAGGIALLFFWPGIREQLQGAGSYLHGEGIINYSADLLSALAPSPLNPVLGRLGLLPAYAYRIVPTHIWMAELLVYVGVIPLLLSGVAWYVYRRRVNLWGWLAVTFGVLSLGPVLHVGGQIFTFTVEGRGFTLPLPYALLANLPFLRYNRVPARLNVTVMLALVVLVAYGLTWLQTRFRPRWHRWLGSGLIVLTVLELLALWPLPLTALTSHPQFAELSDSTGAILNVPVTSWVATERGLFHQIQHRLPIFDGWVQRSLGAEDDPALFLDGLLRPSTPDIVPLPSDAARLAIAQAENVGYVFVFPGAYDVHIPQLLDYLPGLLGPPQFTTSEIVAYAVPSAPRALEEVVYGLSPFGWGSVEPLQGRPARWLADAGHLYIYAPEAHTAALQFRALPLTYPRRLALTVNGQPLSTVVIGDPLVYQTPAFALKQGLNVITFHAIEPATLVEGDPKCAGPARLWGAECNTYLTISRSLSILFQDMALVEADIVPVDVALGEGVTLLGYQLLGEALPGHSLDVLLYWQSLAPLHADYTAFLHLMESATGALGAQFDTLPVSGLYPTSEWRVGDTIVTRMTLTLSPDLPPGEYHLLTGMYTYPDLMRLPVYAERPFAEHGLVWLQSVEIPVH